MATVPCTFPQTVPLDGFDITFVSVVYNLDGTSTWIYTISNINQNTDLSDWLLQLCFDLGDPLVSCSIFPIFGSETCFTQLNDPNICTDSDPNDPCGGQSLSGIKFDNLALGPGQAQTYTFTLNQPFAQELTCFGIKFGNTVRCGLICGPSPECNLVPGRGIIL